MAEIKYQVTTGTDSGLSSRQLLSGEICYSTDKRELKVGNGSTTWNNLPDVGLPVGTIVPFAGSTTPKGYLLCDGTAYSRTTYSLLYNVIGTTYGNGDGSTTFNIPNLKSKFIEGSNSNLGTSKSAGLPNIIGTFNFIGTQDASTSGAFSHTLGDGVGVGYGYTQYRTNLTFEASDSSSIYGNSTTVQPASLCINYLIKYI